MTVPQNWTLRLTPEKVLRAQGAHPRRGGPGRDVLLEAASRALEVGIPYLRPAVAVRTHPVTAIQNDTLQLQGCGAITSRALAHILEQAEVLHACLCTVGDDLLQLGDGGDLLLRFSLDAVATAAVMELAHRVEASLRRRTGFLGYLSPTLSPGMAGWNVLEGQAALFRISDPQRAGVQLTEHGLMRPLKSLSFLVGEGRAPFACTSRCTLCGRQQSCRYRSAL